MSSKGKKKPKNSGLNLATENFNEGYRLLQASPIFETLCFRAHIVRQEPTFCPKEGWAVVNQQGYIWANPFRRGEPAEWVYVLAHCLLHLGFGHFEGVPSHQRHEWNMACDVAINQFLADLKLGTPPADFDLPLTKTGSSEEQLYREFCENDVGLNFSKLGTAGGRDDDMLWQSEIAVVAQTQTKINWKELFGKGLALAVSDAVKVAAGYELERQRFGRFGSKTEAQRAHSWFINSYPLLGSLAAAFKIVENPLICQRMQISMAAVDAESQEIYINPAAGLVETECRFVMAHELLHVGLRHQARREGRDAFLWNVACDFVVNSWLVEMGVGNMPEFGLLYEPILKGLSAEAIYDRIVQDMRRNRKLTTLRGVGLGDMLERGAGEWWKQAAGVDLDEFYKRCLAQGLSYCGGNERGFIPASLIEEIWAISQPPVPWDVELAQWFDNYFAPLEKRRSYARASRRQSATPDIPLPCLVLNEATEAARTYGVVLDTSGSMDRKLLAKALGTIANYSIAHDIPAVRVVFCDAVAYDQGYIPSEAIAEQVRVRGRGGTILQPGIDLLEQVEDFPSDGPILIITDGLCEDSLRIRHEHAYVVPLGHRLPFSPRGPVFYIK